MRTLSLPVPLMNRWKGWGRQENRRLVPGGATPKRRYWLVGLILLGLGVGAPTGWMTVVQYVQQHPYFAINTVEVTLEPGTLFSQEEIIAQSGIALGMNLWTIDPEEVKRRMLASAGIRDVEVRREFPQRVVLQVETRQPIAVVSLPTLTYLDNAGVWFTANTQHTGLDLPYVTGFTTDELDSSAARTALSSMGSLISLAAQLWPEPLSEIHWDRKQGYTMFLTRRHFTIRLGWETAPEKFFQVAKVLAQWPINAPPALIDARFLNQVIARPLLDAYGLRPLTPGDPL